MDRRRLPWIFSVIVLGLSLVKSQSTSPANVPVRELAAKVGYPANFTCGSYGIPLFICVWERQSEKKLTININAELANAGETPVAGYGFAGPGFQAGSCGLLIKEVKDEDNAVWDCKMFTLKGHLYQGNVRVGILKKPSPPVFSTTIQQIKTIVDADKYPNPKVTVTCGSHGGQPPPTFKWFIGNEEITEGLQPYQNSTHDGKMYVSQDLAGHKFTAKDNGMDLRCVVVHDALSESDKKETAEKIVVSYGPRADSAIKPLFVPTLGKDVTLTLNISANPKPVVTWRVGDILINPPQSTPKYNAYPLVEISNGVWAAGLLIRGVEEDDLQKSYKLETSNVYGNAEFDLRISSSDTEAGGLSAGGIVGLVLGIPALLIIIAVIVVYTRARGLLCFKENDGTASEKERMDGESSGAGAAAEEKPTSRRIATRLSAIYDNLVKKKDKTAPAEEDPNKEKDKEVKPEGDTEKKPDDIVYAELDLVNETGGKQVVRGADDKTVYAEIRDVVPQGTDKKDKSPTGSNNGSPKK